MLLGPRRTLLSAHGTAASPPPPPPAGSTWHAGSAPADVTFSPDGRTVTRSASNDGAYRTVRSSKSFTVDTSWELVVNVELNDNVFGTTHLEIAGICNTDFANTDFLGHSPSWGAGFRGDGALYYDFGSQSNDGVPFSTGDRLCFFFHAASKQFFMSKDLGATWCGRFGVTDNPTTLTGGEDLTLDGGVAGPWFAAISLFTANTQFTLVPTGLLGTYPSGAVELG